MDIFLKIFSVLIFITLASAISFLYWAHLGTANHKAYMAGTCKKGEQTPTRLKILSYNIAYGRGLKNDKGNLQDKKTIISYLDKVSDFLKEANADVVLLQEVDLASRRTHYIDEAKYIAEKAGYSCYACVTNWLKNYIPYPLWPPAQHYGRMNSGQCILSKYPIESNRRIVLQMRKDKPFFYTAFYLDRAIQEVEILIGNETFEFFNIHLEAYSIENREEQAILLANLLKETSANNIVIGGDFNALPPDATQKKNFPDEPQEEPWADVSSDQTIERFLKAAPNVEDTFAHSISEDKTFTYPANVPNRRVDYIFTSHNLRILESRVMNPGTISDHLPVYTELEIPKETD